MNTERRSALVRSLLLATVFAWLTPAQAQTVKLFKIVSPKDEVVVGINSAQLGSGSGPEVQRFAALLADKSPLTVWQYASHQEAGGTLVQAPLRQVAIFKNDLLRVEPYSSPLPVRPIAAR
ncbi:MAG: hypothetical protein EOO22_20565 [Comamonadaceae bacterium]|nr:MAG: hypothetical protein EOO22_20565 [Comamonadaceae bacterium]